MARMLAQPESLLNVCLKRSDYGMAKRIIRFFRLPTSRSTEVALAEELDTISRAMSSDRFGGGEDGRPMELAFINELDHIFQGGAEQGGEGGAHNHPAPSTTAVEDETASKNGTVDIADSNKDDGKRKGEGDGEAEAEAPLAVDLAMWERLGGKIMMADVLPTPLHRHHPSIIVATATEVDTGAIVATTPSTGLGDLRREASLAAPRASHARLYGFYMCVDLAICDAPTIIHSRDLLVKAQQLLTEWYASVDSSLAVERTLHSYFTQFVATYQLVIDSYQTRQPMKPPPLSALLSNIETMPMEPNLLESHLSRMQSKMQALSALRSVFNEMNSSIHLADAAGSGTVGKKSSKGAGKSPSRGGARGGAAKGGTKGGAVVGKTFLGSLIREFGSTVAEDEAALVSSDKLGRDVAGTVGYQYLRHFLQYMTEISISLQQARPRENASEDVSLDLLAIVRRAPRRLLASLVFERHGLAEAQRLAKIMRIDMLKVVLRYCRPLVNEMSKSRGLMSDITKDGNAASGDDDKDMASFPLSMEVVEFVASMERQRPLSDLRGGVPLLATLACLQRTPTSALDARFVSYALEHSAAFPALHRWTCQRAQALSNLIDIFLRAPGQASAENDDAQAAEDTRTAAKEVASSGGAQQAADDSGAAPGTSSDDDALATVKVSTAVADWESKSKGKNLGEGQVAGDGISIDGDGIGNVTDADTGKSISGAAALPEHGQAASASPKFPMDASKASGNGSPPVGGGVGGGSETSHDDSTAWSTWSHVPGADEQVSDPVSAFLSFESRSFATSASYEHPVSRDALPEADRASLDKLSTEDVSGEEGFYDAAVERLVRQGELARAMALADATLPPGTAKVELLLRQLVEQAEDKGSVHVYIRRMIDKVEASELTLTHLHHFDVDVGIELLYMCACHLRPQGGGSRGGSRQGTTSTPSGLAVVAEDDPVVGDDDVGSSGGAVERATNAMHVLRDRVLAQLARLRTHRAILAVDDSWQSWQAVAEALDHTDLAKAEVVVRRLAVLRQHDLAHQVMHLWRLHDRSPVLLKDLEESHLLDLLTRLNDKPRAFRMLDQAARADAVAAATICRSLVDKVESHHTKLLLVQFILHLQSRDSRLAGRLASGIDGHRQLEVLELSLKILIRLPGSDVVGRPSGAADGIPPLPPLAPEPSTSTTAAAAAAASSVGSVAGGVANEDGSNGGLQRRLRHLIGFPSLLVENLLMAQRTDLVQTLFADFAELRNDDVVIAAVSKALDLDSGDGRTTGVSGSNTVAGAANMSTASTTAPSTQTKAGVAHDASTFGAPAQPGGILGDASDFLTLTGDHAKDERIRAVHCYPQAPSIKLATALLDLCSDPAAAGKACFRLCDRLSLALGGTEASSTDGRTGPSGSRFGNRRHGGGASAPGRYRGANRGERGGSGGGGGGGGVGGAVPGVSPGRRGGGSGGSLRTRSAPRAPLLVLSLVQQLLQYAKRQFQKVRRLPLASTSDVSIRFGVRVLGSGKSGFAYQALCDAYLKCLGLLRQLHKLSARGKPYDVFAVSLTSLRIPQRARLLRDALTSEGVDRMHLALELCQTCAVEVEPVYAAWGLALVRVGRFADARQKFAYCLTNLPPREVNSLVQRIVSLIECRGELPPDLNELQQRHVHMSRCLLDASLPHSHLQTRRAGTGRGGGGLKGRMERGGGGGAGGAATSVSAAGLHGSMESKRGPNSRGANRDGAVDDDESHRSMLEPSLLQECLFYLKTCDAVDPSALVAFYARHGMLTEACRTVFNKGLRQSVFLETVVEYCLANALMPDLQAAVMSIDATLHKVRDYLLALCEYLRRRGLYQLLYAFQAFMSDDLGAALTCERLFATAPDFDGRMGHLLNAKNHYLRLLQRMQTQTAAPASLAGGAASAGLGDGGNPLLPQDAMMAGAGSIDGLLGAGSTGGITLEGENKLGAAHGGLPFMGTSVAVEGHGDISGIRDADGESKGGGGGGIAGAGGGGGGGIGAGATLDGSAGGGGAAGGGMMVGGKLMAGGGEDGLKPGVDGMVRDGMQTWGSRGLQWTWAAAGATVISPTADDVEWRITAVELQMLILKLVPSDVQSYNLLQPCASDGGVYRDFRDAESVYQRQQHVVVKIMVADHALGLRAMNHFHIRPIDCYVRCIVHSARTPIRPTAGGGRGGGGGGGDESKPLRSMRRSRLTRLLALIRRASSEADWDIIVRECCTRLRDDLTDLDLARVLTDAFGVAQPGAFVSDLKASLTPGDIRGAFEVAQQSFSTAEMRIVLDDAKRQGELASAEQALSIMQV